MVVEITYASDAPLDPQVLLNVEGGGGGLNADLDSVRLHLSFRLQQSALSLQPNTFMCSPPQGFKSDDYHETTLHVKGAGGGGTAVAGLTCTSFLCQITRI